MLLVLAVTCLVAAVFLFGEVAAAPGQERMRSIRLAAGYGRRLYTDTLTRESFGQRIVAPLRLRLASLVLRFSPRTTLDSVAVRLLRAGMARRLTPSGFLALKALGAFVGIVGGAVLGAASSGAAAALVVTVGLAICGFLLPDAVLTLRTRSRRDQIERTLPNALDLLAVSVEAGLGFDAAIAKVGDQIGGPLAEELRLVLHELRLGQSRDNALRRFAERSGSPTWAASCAG